MKPLSPEAEKLKRLVAAHRQAERSREQCSHPVDVHAWQYWNGQADGLSLAIQIVRGEV